MIKENFKSIALNAAKKQIGELKKINRVFDQPVTASNMGSKGKEIMQEHFAWDSIAKKFMLILNQNT